MFYDQDGQWVETWSSGYYGDTLSPTCQPCHYFWTEWYGLSSTECTAWNQPDRYVLIQYDTCVYLSCPVTTYYNQTFYSCKDCNRSWYTWYGPSESDCLSWPPTEFIDLDGKCKTCSEINSAYKYSTTSNTCIEKCGKGYNLGELPCDDGNTSDGDGWNHVCQVEVDWECSGGNSSTPDACISLLSPFAEFTSLNKGSHIAKIAFSENIVLQSLEPGDLAIDITGPLSPYEFTYKIDNTTGYTIGEVTSELQIKFFFESSLLGSNGKLYW